MFGNGRMGAPPRVNCGVRSAWRGPLVTAARPYEEWTQPQSYELQVGHVAAEVEDSEELSKRSLLGRTRSGGL